MSGRGALGAAASLALASATVWAGGLTGGGDAAARSASGRLAIGVAPQTSLGASDYGRIREAGIDMIRLPVYWSHIQSAPGDCAPQADAGVCDWTALDDAVGNSAWAGATLLPYVYVVPPFIARHQYMPPISAADRWQWRDFLDALARRYGPGGLFWENEFRSGSYGGEPRPITDWQIWNEPNGKVFYHPRPDARDYGKLVKISSNALRAADPQARLILAGMFGGAEVRLSKFLRTLYRVEGIRRHFDAIALHPYARGLGQLKGQMRTARRISRRAGDGGIELWITELGWSSAKGEHPLEKGTRGQASLLTRVFGFLRERRERWNIRAVVWFTWQDRHDRAACRFCRNAGLFTIGGEPKPSWAALKRQTGAG